VRCGRCEEDCHRKHSKDKKKSHKKHRDLSKEGRRKSNQSDDDSSSSSSGEDGPDVKRSIISGKKIKMHINKTDDDLVRERLAKTYLSS